MANSCRGNTVGRRSPSVSFLRVYHLGILYILIYYMDVHNVIQISGKLRRPRRRQDCGVYFSYCCCDESSSPRERNCVIIIIIIVLYSACRRDISKRPRAKRPLPKIAENPSSIRKNIAHIFGSDTKSRKRFVGQ